MNCVGFDNTAIEDWVNWAAEIASKQPEGQAVEDVSTSESESDIESVSGSSGCPESRAYHDYWRGSSSSSGVICGDLPQRQTVEAALGEIWDEVEVDKEEQKVEAALSEASNDIDEFGNSPLHRACESGRKGRYFESLLKDGHEVNRKNEEGDTALHIAVRNRKLMFIELLLENGASCDIQNGKGKTALHLVAKERSQSQCNRKMFDIILSKSADVHQADMGGVIPLILLAKNDDWSGVNAVMTKQGPSPFQDSDGNNILHLALSADNVSGRLLKDILEQAPELAKIQNSVGDTPFHLAGKKRVSGFGLEFWQPFVQREGLEAQDKDGSTPLHILAKENRTGVLRKCLEVMLGMKDQGEEFNLDIQNNSRKTVLSLLQEQKQSKEKPRCEQLISKIKGAG